MALLLDPIELRTLATLIEKHLTTPQNYPLTTAALLAGCNQSTSRDPVTDFDEATLLGALDTLRREHGLVRVIHPSHGRSVDRWRHVFDEALGLITEEIALLGVLMLRGPQTVAELRTRTERMAAFEDPDTVESILARLSAYPEPLAACVGRQPGQSQDRWIHLLASDASEPSPAAFSDAPLAEPTEPAEVSESLSERVRRLEGEVAALRATVDELKEMLGG